jgi:hypothetical protein
MESGSDSSNDPEFMYKEEQTWVCSILKHFTSSFSLMPYSELEETTASFTKLFG